jgi:hypothetical protein
MLHPVVVMLESAAGVVRWVDEDASDLPSKLLFEGFKSEKVVTEDEAVIEQVVVGHTVRRVIGLLRVFEQDARLKSGPILLPDPGEFKFLLGHVFLVVLDPTVIECRLSSFEHVNHVRIDCWVLNRS